MVKPKTTLHTFRIGSLSPNIISTKYWDLMAFIHTQHPTLKEGGIQGYYYMVGPPTYPTLYVGLRLGSSFVSDPKDLHEEASPFGSAIR
ncbi:hypothetical protein K504DRAFT_461992 [Pleomassaria siparia CBS 279.74]|uniref:Uncharacterized protein n=1 Tax=Pleomassaria siparia CBS 279.74 TaxID=1314801 RepID=A0A6G1KLG2_9PLEO|nr:hypothetical protein K504DRAFT_461992 [Pleomassaria siparia CBS 279.74]